MSESEKETMQSTEAPDAPEETMNPEEEDKDAVLQAIDELADRAHEIERIKEELEQATDQVKRQAAEFQNYRRRTEQEKAMSVTLGKSLVISSLLDTIDDFERSLDATNKAESETESELSPAYQSLKSGVELVYQKLTGELKKLGVEPIEAVGEPFDEELHEAMMQQPAEEGQEAGIVLTEIQRGYRMGDRVLRHARVIVSS
ncbi:MAG: nucleotide exchange factor GrpE [Bacteroidota bacterium]|nr:nucleotide exchange factor GrpE [Bacteroidota bacterium]